MENTRQNSQLPLLELDLLKTIVVIAETGNFSSAAEKLFRTPSAVSMQVKRIEQMLGRAVFRRDSRSVTPTSDGEVLLEHGRRLLALNNEMVSRFVMPEVAGTVRLGATEDIAERLLPGLLQRFAQSHCCVTVDVAVNSTTMLRESVRSGAMDLALTTFNPKKKIKGDIEPVFQERLVWAGLRNGVAFEKRPLPISVWEEGCSWRDAAISSLEAADIDHRVAFMSAHISGQRAAILADLAVAPIPVSCCINDIVELSEKDGLPKLSTYGVGLLLQKKPSEPAQAAAEHIRASFSQ
ncbi:MAG: LysR family transcriptional regulator [Gammaproteobacteria bacterium]|nr:LysR family transcriptional regulator [Gammaproteobacteria bacterium]